MYPPKFMILNVDFALKLNKYMRAVKTFYMSLMNPKKFVHNTTYSVQHHTLPVTPFKQHRKTENTTIFHYFLVTTVYHDPMHGTRHPETVKFISRSWVDSTWWSSFSCRSPWSGWWSTPGSKWSPWCTPCRTRSRWKPS